MSDIIKVGNRVRRASWPDRYPYVIVSAVGRNKFLAVDKYDNESQWTIIDPVFGDWVLAEERSS